VPGKGIAGIYLRLETLGVHGNGFGDYGRFESWVGERRDVQLRSVAAFIDRRITGLAFTRCR
jgi:hypothetical protein